MIQGGILLYLMIGLLISEINYRYYVKDEVPFPYAFKTAVALLWPIFFFAMVVDFVRFCLGQWDE